MSWYYIDGAGTTLGPVEYSELQNKWNSKQINPNTYVWNGTTVNEWSLISACSDLSNKLKGGNKPAPPRGGPAKPKPAGGGRPKKKAGGARVNLLDSIRSGKSLKKVEKKDLPSNIGGSKSGGSGGGMKKGGKMSLQDQLKMKLQGKGGARGGPKKTFGAKPKASNTGGGFGGPKKTGGFGGPKKTTTSSGGGSKWQAKKSAGGAKASSGGDAPMMKKFEMKKAIDACNDDWILKAISKLLS